MLSRRDRLLVQPWEDRRFKDHRAKVAGARAAVDARAPAARPHVALKAAAWRRERERAARVAADNRALLQRLAAVMRARRLDNHWAQPPPNFHHKVGQYVGARQLAARLAARAGRCAPPDQSPAAPAPAVRCYACEDNKLQYQRRAAPPAPRHPRSRHSRGSLPPVH